MKYENRVVLFLDILGFKNVIDKTVDKNDIDNENNIQLLYDAISQMYSEVTWQPSNLTSRVITQFSDSIVLSFLIDDSNEVIQFFDDILHLITMLIKKGLLCRGAISYGKLIHNERVIFGPAMIEAYLTESKAALYPRVILDRSLLDILHKNQKAKNKDIYWKAPFFINYVEEDLDDKFYLDYILKARYVMAGDEYLEEYLPILRKNIIDGLRFKSPDIKVKFGWLKNKFNNSIELLNTQSKYYGVNEYLTQLKKIKKIE